MSFHQKRLSSCKTASSERGKLLVVGLNRLSRGAAGNEDFDNRVAAETVAAVDAAGNLASRVQTRDHVVLSVQRVALGIDLDTAHGVVGGRRHEADAQLHAVELVGLGQVVAALVLLGVADQGVPAARRP